MNESDFEYAGFWIRVAATIIDTLLIMAITFPLLISIYGWKYFGSDSLISGPADFLNNRGQTPYFMLLSQLGQS